MEKTDRVFEKTQETKIEAEKFDKALEHKFQFIPITAEKEFVIDLFTLSQKEFQGLIDLLSRVPVQDIDLMGTDASLIQDSKGNILLHSEDTRFSAEFINIIRFIKFHRAFYSSQDFQQLILERLKDCKPRFDGKNQEVTDEIILKDLFSPCKEIEEELFQHENLLKKIRAGISFAGLLPEEQKKYHHIRSKLWNFISRSSTQYPWLKKTKERAGVIQDNGYEDFETGLENEVVVHERVYYQQIGSSFEPSHTRIILKQPKGAQIDLCEMLPSKTIFFKQNNGFGGYLFYVEPENSPRRSLMPEGKSSKVIYPAIENQIQLIAMLHEIGHAWDEEERGCTALVKQAKNSTEEEAIIASGERNADAFALKKARHFRTQGFLDESLTNEKLIKFVATQLYRKSHEDIPTGSYDPYLKRVKL